MKRPITVSIVAWFLFAATFIAWMVATALLHPTGLTEWMFTFNPPARAGFERLGWVASLLLFALGIGTLAAAIELRRGGKWAWWFAVTLFIMNICGDLVAFFVLHDWMRSGSGVVIGLVFVAVLLQPKVKSFCQH